MGIVRLAKSLRILKSINEYSSRQDDINNKISGNRVYMDFISIVYKTQENTVKELNYLLFSFILIINGLINTDELFSEKFIYTLNKYSEHINIYEKIIEIIKLDDTLDNTIKELQKIINIEFINIFKENIRQKNVLNEYIYQDIVNYITDLLTNKIINVEYILIAFDGIPSFGKIQEQRQRRYMRIAFNEFKKIITSQVDKKTNIKLINIRRDYDKEHFEENIKLAIEYVYEMYHKNNLQNDIRNRFEVLKNKIPIIEVIDRKYGEGEKILMDKLIIDYKKFRDTKTYVFYSPDGDSVILCLNVYIKTKIKSLNVVKMYILNPSKQHNNQSQYIDVKILYENIIEYVKEYSHKEINKKEYDLICNDFILMINLYGNDFIHQIPTMEISATIMNLIYIYSRFIRENNYLTRLVKDKVLINYKSFKKFISYLSDYENYLMLDTYLVEIENRNRIIRTFGNIFTHRYLLDYKDTIHNYKRELLKNVENNTNREEIKQMVSDMITQLNEITTITGKKYGEIFMKIEVKNINNYVAQILADKNMLRHNKPSFIYKIYSRKNRNEKDIQEIVKIVEEQLIKNNKSIDVNSLRRSNNREINDFSFDYSNIREFIPHDQMPTTKKDIDLFLLEWKSGKWMNIMNSYSFNLGYDSKRRRVKSIDSEMKRYQHDMLKVNNRNLNKMVKDFLRTISWVNDYYMNTDFNSTKKYISSWSYNYERSPFISHINNYIKKITDKDFENIMNNVYKKSLINTDNFLDEEKHKLYIYPQEKVIINSLPKEYHKYFPDIYHYIDETIKMSKNNKINKRYFDCRMCPYFSKCIFKSEMITYRELKQMKVDNYRKLKRIKIE